MSFSNRIIRVFSIFVVINLSNIARAEWEPVAISGEGLTYYIDRTQIRKNNGFVYFWVLADYLEPQNGSFSSKDYYKGICATNMITLQSIQWFLIPMAKGEPDRVTNFERESDAWIEAQSGTLMGQTLNAVCN